MVSRSIAYGLCCYCAALSALQAVVAQESAYITPSHNLERYTSLWKKSPFSPETTGIMVYDEAPVVTLTNRDTLKTISLSPGQSTENLSLVRAEWADASEKSFAVLSINGAEKKITFDQQSLATLRSRSAPPTTQKVNPNRNKTVPTTKKTIPKTRAAGSRSSIGGNQIAPRRRIIRRSP